MGKLLIVLLSAMVFFISIGAKGCGEDQVNEVLGSGNKKPAPATQLCEIDTATKNANGEITDVTTTCEEVADEAACTAKGKAPNAEAKLVEASKCIKGPKECLIRTEDNTKVGQTTINTECESTLKSTCTGEDKEWVVKSATCPSPVTAERACESSTTNDIGNSPLKRKVTTKCNTDVTKSACTSSNKWVDRAACKVETVEIGLCRTITATKDASGKITDVTTACGKRGIDNYITQAACNAKNTDGPGTGVEVKWGGVVCRDGENVVSVETGATKNVECLKIPRSVFEKKVNDNKKQGNPRTIKWLTGSNTCIPIKHICKVTKLTETIIDSNKPEAKVIAKKSKITCDSTVEANSDCNTNKFSEIIDRNDDGSIKKTSASKAEWVVDTKCEESETAETKLCQLDKDIKLGGKPSYVSRTCDFKTEEDCDEEGKKPNYTSSHWGPSQCTPGDKLCKITDRRTHKLIRCGKSAKECETGGYEAISWINTSEEAEECKKDDDTN